MTPEQRLAALVADMRAFAQRLYEASRLNSNRTASRILRLECDHLRALLKFYSGEKHE